MELIVLMVIIGGVIFYLLKRPAEVGDANTAKRVRVNKESISPNFAHDNIALNSNTRQVWLRGRGGNTIVLDVAKILGSTHRWIERQKNRGVGFDHYENHIEIKTRDLEHPVFLIDFTRERNPNDNYAQASEWSNRLSLVMSNND